MLVLICPCVCIEFVHVSMLLLACLVMFLIVFRKIYLILFQLCALISMYLCLSELNQVVSFVQYIDLLSFAFLCPIDQTFSKS